MCTAGALLITFGLFFTVGGYGGTLAVKYPPLAIGGTAGVVMIVLGIGAWMVGGCIS